MRSRWPACRTLPSSTVRTPSRGRSGARPSSLPLKANADVRDATRSASMPASALMISSVIPSLKYSASVSALRLRNGSTAIEASAPSRGARGRVARTGPRPERPPARRFEREREVARRLEALLGTLLEAVRDDLGELRRQRPRRRASGAAPPSGWPSSSRRRCRRWKARSPGQHLVEDHAEREEVRALVQRGLPRTCSGDM